MNAIVELDGVTKDFRAKGGKMLRAVDGVSLTVRPGETLGIVGRIGLAASRRSAALILGLHEPYIGRGAIRRP